MARIEELVDEDHQSLNVRSRSPLQDGSRSSKPVSVNSIPSSSTPFSTPSAPNGSSNLFGPAPALPPQMVSAKAHSIDEVAAYLKRTPLFMTSLDAESTEDNPELEAMRALQYEGTRAEIAQGFRESGNEMAKVKKWADGKEFYTKALAALRAERKEDEEGGEQEDRKERDIEEACYSNRALCNLELKNYRSCTLDCASTLRLNNSNIKAYYRSSLALLALKKLPEALDACKHGLAVDSTNIALQSLLQKINIQKATLDALEQKRLDRELRQKKEEAMLRNALKARTVRTRSTGQPPEMEDAAIRLVPDPLSPTSTLTFPVVILYPLHLQSDFIKAFGEEQTLAGHLDYLFPLPWDTKGDYTVQGVEAYMETVTGGLIKWGKKVPLLKVLGGGKVEVVDGIVKVNVVPKSGAAGWIEEVKRRKVGD
ncbi:hypothetical protein MMC24_004867 [Lignoscripta atroalba]|nr:hypothetical protein [Lignoscripta atroalba]